MKAAVSRLDFTPPISQIEVDIDKGVMEFTPQPAKAVSASALKQAIEAAGYRVGQIAIRAKGEVTTGGGSPALKIPASDQVFLLSQVPRFSDRSQVTISGMLKTRGAGPEVIEVVEGSHRQANLGQH